MPTARFGSRPLFVALLLCAACASAPPPAPAPAAATASAATAASVASAAPTGTRDGLLIFTRSTGFVHKSTPTAAQAIAAAAAAAGLKPEISEDPAKFTPAELQRYGAVLLLATAGKPLAPADAPGTAAIEALLAFIRGGGGFIGIHNATNAHVDSPEFVSLLGAIFGGHPGGVRTATCTKEADHPAVAKLPASFAVTDEIYVFKTQRPDNQILLRCADERLAMAWHRTEGRGRIFYSALGHRPEAWTEPPLVEQHVLPGILWAMGR